MAWPSSNGPMQSQFAARLEVQTFNSEYLKHFKMMQMRFKCFTPAPAHASRRGVAGPQARASMQALPVVANCVSQAHPSRAAMRSREGRRGLVVVAAAPTKNIELQVSKEELGACRRRLTITMPASGVEVCFHKAVDKMRDIVGEVQGFRKDKIPLSIIITRCGGQHNFKMTCIEEIMVTAMPLAMEQAIKAEGVVPDSEQVVSNIQDLEAAFDPAKPLTFTVEYDTVPPLVWKKSYKDIEVTIKDTGDFNTDTTAAEGLVRELLKERSHQKVVTHRGLQQGDTAIVDLTFTEEGSKLPLPGLSANKARIDTDMDPLNLTPHLLGIKVGETRKFQVQLPDDYRIELWQGMVCNVEVVVKELFEWQLPEGQFKTADELRQSLLATTAMERVRLLDEELSEAVQKAVVACVEAPPLPASLVQDMGTTQYRAMLLEMIEKKSATHEEVDRLATPEMVEEYCEKKKDELEAMCIFNIAADEIWVKEGLTLDEQDVQAEIKFREQQYKAQKLDYDVEAIRDQVVDTFKHLKTVEWLKDNVKRTVLPYSAS